MNLVTLNIISATTYSCIVKSIVKNNVEMTNSKYIVAKTYTKTVLTHSISFSFCINVLTSTNNN